MLSKTSLAKIHIAKKELGLSDETYRDILHLHFGVDSAAKLNDRQGTVLLNHFRAKGWQPKQPVGERSRTTVKNGRKASKKVNDNYRHIKPGPAAAQQKYVLALWSLLGYEIKKLDSRCHTQFGVDRIEWLTEHDDLHILITDLRKRCRDAGLELRS